jgi:hypothetical protein
MANSKIQVSDGRAARNGSASGLDRASTPAGLVCGVLAPIDSRIPIPRHRRQAECRAAEYFDYSSIERSTVNVVEPTRRSSSDTASVVAGRFLGQLHAGGEAEFGVDVGEVGLHRAR